MQQNPLLIKTHVGTDVTHIFCLGTGVTFFVFEPLLPACRIC